MNKLIYLISAVALPAIFIATIKFLKSVHIFLIRRTNYPVVKSYNYNGVKVKEVRSSPVEFGFYDKRINTLFVNYNLPPILKKYVIAHEFCHSTYKGLPFTSVWAEINCIFLRKRK